MFHHLRMAKNWWWVNKPKFKFWGAVLLFFVFGAIPWVIGIGIYLKLLFNWMV